MNNCCGGWPDWADYLPIATFTLRRQLNMSQESLPDGYLSVASRRPSKYGLIQNWLHIVLLLGGDAQIGLHLIGQSHIKTCNCTSINLLYVFGYTHCMCHYRSDNILAIYCAALMESNDIQTLHELTVQLSWQMFNFSSSLLLQDSGTRTCTASCNTRRRWDCWSREAEKKSGTIFWTRYVFTKMSWLYYRL